MIRGGIGGANTKTGLVFEGRSDLATFLGRKKTTLLMKIHKCFTKANL